MTRIEPVPNEVESHIGKAICVLLEFAGAIPKEKVAEYLDEPKIAIQGAIQHLKNKGVIVSKGEYVMMEKDKNLPPREVTPL